MSELELDLVSDNSLNWLSSIDASLEIYKKVLILRIQLQDLSAKSNESSKLLTILQKNFKNTSEKCQEIYNYLKNPSNKHRNLYPILLTFVQEVSELIKIESPTNSGACAATANNDFDVFINIPLMNEIELSDSCKQALINKISEFTPTKINSASSLKLLIELPRCELEGGWRALSLYYNQNNKHQMDPLYKKIQAILLYNIPIYFLSIVKESWETCETCNDTEALKPKIKEILDDYESLITTATKQNHPKLIKFQFSRRHYVVELIIRGLYQAEYNPCIVADDSRFQSAKTRMAKLVKGGAGPGGHIAVSGGALFMGVTAPIGGIVAGFGALAGVARSLISRNPLNPTELKECALILNEIATRDEAREKLISEIQCYNKDKASSAASAGLVETLQKIDVTKEDAWRKIVAYMMMPYENNPFSFANNGRELFCFILEKAKEVLQPVQSNSAGVK